MASNNEAKIKFTAETSDFNASLKEAKNATKELNAEMRLAAAEFKNTGDSAEYLNKKHDLLESKLEENRKQQDALNNKIEVATDIYGENSDEVNKLEAQLTNAQVAEQKIISEIKDCNDALEENASQAQEAESAYGQLTSEIESQEATLDELKQQYINAALEMGTDSEEAQNLADQISTLSGELQDNKEKLEDVTESADELDQTMDKTGKESSNMGSIFGGSIGSMAQAIAAGGIAGAVSEMVEMAVELAKEVVELANDWSESTAVMAEGTGATGEKLEDLTNAAYDAYKQLSDVNVSAQDVAGTLAELNTRLGLTGDDATEATEVFSQFAKVTGQDAEGAVDDIVDAMKRWGMDTDISNIKPLLDDITTASQSCSLSASDMTGLLSDNAYQFQALGYSADEALGFITAMADGGMNTSQMTTALRNSVKNLTDATDDVPGSFQEAIKMIQDADGDSSVLNKTIGNTGKTIEETFGTKAAQEMVLSLSTSGGAIDDFTSILKDNDGSTMQTYEDSITLKDEWSRLGKNVKGTVSQSIGPACKDAVGFFADLFDKNSDVRQGMEENAKIQADAVVMQSQSTQSAIDDMKGAFGSFKEKAGEAWSNVKTSTSDAKSNISNKLSGLKGNLTDAGKNGFDNLKNKVSTVAGNMKTSMTSAKSGISGNLSSLKTNLSSAGEKFTSMKNTAVTALSNLKTSAAGKMAGLKSALSSGLGKCKSLFNFNWSLPKIKLPHFKITGKFSLNPPSIPHFSVSWYAKAMDNPMILNGATIFGASGGNLLGGGEAGEEVVSGKETLLGLFQEAVSSELYGALSAVDSVVDKLDALEQAVRESGNIYLNSKKVSEGLASDSAAVNGTRYNLTKRGVLV